MNNDWIRAAAERIRTERVAHQGYIRAVDDVFNAMTVAQGGELVVFVGPSRVGKSRAIKEAVDAAVKQPCHNENELPYALIEAENACANGKFSTKSFMRQACRAVNHPIYGAAHESDPWQERLNARINRTPEGMLRDAFEHALGVLKTKFVIIDEAHHVAYAARGEGTPIAVLDSWKCLANKTGVVLCLVGSYQLLRIIAQAPHLIGRQRHIEFPRYRIENRRDILAFEGLLKVWSEPIRFDANRSLRSWTPYLFTHTFGCAGHLSKWVRSALGFVGSRKLEFFNEEALRATRLPAYLEEQAAAEIILGEQDIAARELLKATDDVSNSPSCNGTRKRKRKPFQRTTQRFELDGRNES